MHQIKEITQQEFNEKVLKANRPVVVDFYSDWCVPCLTQLPSLEIFARNHARDMDVVQVNVDRFPELAQTYWVRNLPMQLLFLQGKPTTININSDV